MVKHRKEQINVLRAYWSKLNFTATGGSGSTTISAATLNTASITGTSGADAGSLTPSRGIVTTGSYNICKLRHSDDGSLITDGYSGIPIFGKLTFSTNYILSYYKYNSGSLVATTLPGTGSINIGMLFPEILNYSEVPAYVSLIDEAGWGGGDGYGSTSSITIASGTANGYLNRTVYSTPGTTIWTTSADITAGNWFDVIIVGGGGGGGGGDTTTNGGAYGAAGGCYRKLRFSRAELIAMLPISIVIPSVASGGTGKITADSASDGGLGGTTQFGTHKAYGGGGGYRGGSFGMAGSTGGGSLGPGVNGTDGTIVATPVSGGLPGYTGRGTGTGGAGAPAADSGNNISQCSEDGGAGGGTTSNGGPGHGARSLRGGGGGGCGGTGFPSTPVIAGDGGSSGIAAGAERQGGGAAGSSGVTATNGTAGASGDDTHAGSGGGGGGRANSSGAGGTGGVGGSPGGGGGGGGQGATIGGTGGAGGGGWCIVVAWA